MNKKRKEEAGSVSDELYSKDATGLRMTTSKCSSRLSHSDYCSIGSCSSDEESTSTKDTHNNVLPAGVCPHCHRIFEQPVSLQCGHSLCLTCCNTLLPIASRYEPVNRRRPRMGVSSCLASTPVQMPKIENDGIVYRTPGCLVCGAGPSQAAPIPNLELDNFLRNIKSFKWHLNDSQPRNNRRREEEGFSIHECKIAVIGARGVGKTCLTRVQYSNEIMFPDMSTENDDSDSYIIDILDGMDVRKTYTNAHGIIIVYSVADRQSFYEAAELYKRVENGREHNQPIILVGSKTDKEKRREVSPSEGQQLARNFGCSFFEVSSKRNECVHEAFTELVGLIQNQQHVWINAMSKSL